MDSFKHQPATSGILASSKARAFKRRGPATRTSPGNIPLKFRSIMLGIIVSTVPLAAYAETEVTRTGNFADFKPL